MPEYIDKKAVVGILEAMSRNAVCDCVGKWFEKAAKRIAVIPAANVAPVVRCKDCERRGTPECGMYYECGECGQQHTWETDNDFCSLWRKRDNA